MSEERSSHSSDVQLRIDPQSRSAASRGGAASADTVAAPRDQAEQPFSAANRAAGPPVVAYELREFAAAPQVNEPITLDRIRDVELDLKIELGRTQMSLQDVLNLRAGSVVPLDKLAGDLVDIMVNGRMIARGEVLVLGDNFCVRVTELIGMANHLAEERAA